jgi:hypothetical protein
MNTKFLLKYKKDILIGLLITYCHLHSTQVRRNFDLHSADTLECVNKSSKMAYFF